MTTDKRTLAVSTALACCAALLPGCAETSLLAQPGDAAFGEANRQTMMAQVVNPDPVYEDTMTASGHLAAEAIDRYRNDRVKRPDTIRTTNVGSGEGTGSGPN